MKKIIAAFSITLLLIAGSIICRWYFSPAYKTSSQRKKNLFAQKLEVYKSDVDKDKDGVDDQTDILENAISYINTVPKYKSEYYDTGYPDNSYGVCTDVVAFALRDAGYDLKTLVQEDIVRNPDDYDIEMPDENIDFRRVKNLRVFFEHNALSLTTDLTKIDEWQGGDIVVFQKHIGIISDRRNARGIPYVIHHNSPKQKSYEEDILEKRKDIVAHFRIS